MTKRAAPKQMFAGPLIRIRNPDTNRLIRVDFELFGAAFQIPLVLSYGNLEQARKKRGEILAVDNVAAIPTQRLSRAVKQALLEAYPQGRKHRPQAP